jgi:hypothetical protein
VQEFKITYRDGATQTVKAEQHIPQGEWVVFTDITGIVLRVPSKDVQSIARAGVEDRTEPFIGIA